MTIKYEAKAEEVRKVTVKSTHGGRQGVIYLPKSWIAKPVAVVREAEIVPCPMGVCPDCGMPMKPAFMKKNENGVDTMVETGAVCSNNHVFLKQDLIPFHPERSVRLPKMKKAVK